MTQEAGVTVIRHAPPPKKWRDMTAEEVVEYYRARGMGSGIG